MLIQKYIKKMHEKLAAESQKENKTLTAKHDAKSKTHKTRNKIEALQSWSKSHVNVLLFIILSKSRAKCEKEYIPFRQLFLGICVFVT